MLVTNRLNLLLLAVVAYGQALSTEPRFEVASIKKTLSLQELRLRGETAPVPTSDPAQLHLHTSLEALIRQAYNMDVYQKVTGPDWMGFDWFEIMAKLPEGATQEQVPGMLRTLLAERFKLVVRREAKEQPVYVLTAGPDGPRLKEAPPGANGSSEWRSRLNGRAPVMRTTTPNGWLIYSRLSGNVVLDANKISMPDLALALSREVGHQPVLDQTGLKGLYEVSIPVPATWLKDATPPGSAADVAATQAADPFNANIFKSVEKLGLLLKKSKASIENLDVVHVEKLPTPN
jgi:uncharacterized protein (TIGR03435 family)